jgi:hypothetical protein
MVVEIGLQIYDTYDTIRTVAETSYKLLRQTDEAAALASKGDDVEALIKAAKRCLLNSFSASILISTADGLRPISQIRVGDLSWLTTRPPAPLGCSPSLAVAAIAGDSRIAPTFDVPTWVLYPSSHSSRAAPASC